MRSAIFWTKTRHGRSQPRKHSFDYPLYTFALDLDELEDLRVPTLLFGHNRFGLFSVRDDDYLEGSGTLRERHDRALVRAGVPVRPVSVTLLTMPRYLGYVFNPVSFYVGRDAEGGVATFVCEVNNTFGETHLYAMAAPPAASLPIKWRFAKEFFVSPFYDVSGEYELTLEELSGNRLSLKVTYERGGEPVFFASLYGDGAPMSASRLLSTALRYPITGLVTMGRIYLQAFALAFRARSPIYEKPPPRSENTFRSRQNALHRARLAALRLFERARGLSGGAAACENGTDDR